DFIAYNEIIVETKALRKISDIERAQVVNYLKATGFTRAILLNFGANSLEYERIVLNHDPESASSA
ncbi:MAG: GxxExxY protein, partial [Tepidisphaeraceae bacterium]